MQHHIFLRRKDVLLRFMVDLGRLYLSTLGLKKTRELLRQQHVPETVIIRILSFPGFRNINRRS
ncbi:hypothetical protein LPB67_14505 [Undibacterium sp. Jales W-56]|uniref:hypothetical protein n=1 Tax=Undibacterium sp. Jales W-56 TaxID=2897325 RepID=UPI0021D2E649|nr:hypothetical protein [Undibacterium sp. Jales W-56]MCU6434985.1 hypothetical protein [Undibacterium sp. Jales W-56]